MFWITCIALGFIVIEGLCVCLFPKTVKTAMEEASPNTLIFAGLLESLFGAVLLYVFLVFR
jgi:uncharacterized protein YjeT (DUF2065 family)